MIGNLTAIVKNFIKSAIAIAIIVVDVIITAAIVISIMNECFIFRYLFKESICSHEYCQEELDKIIL